MTNRPRANERAVGATQVVGQGRLAVGTGLHETPVVEAVPGAVAQEGRDRLASLMPFGLGRHRDNGVLSEEGDDAVDVVVEERVSESRDQISPRSRRH